MTAERISGLLVRLYPARWRARYGEELQALILESTGGRRVPWRVRANVAVGAGRERLREAGLAGDGPPAERTRGGALLVLCAWTAFVVAGAVVQKTSEHWQDATPAASRALPAGAYSALVAAAAIGSALVVTGVALAIPSLIVFVRAGGWREIRRPVRRALFLTALAAAATVALAVWAHRLNASQRNGHDVGYGIGATAWALLFVACLASWTTAAVSTARRIVLSPRVLRIEAWLAAAVGATMAAMTAATVLWWAALADVAPWFLAGEPVGAAASPLAPRLLAATMLMAAATALAAAGAVRAVRALPGLAEVPR